MIPLGRIRATPKNGGYMDVGQKNEYFWAKNGPRRPPRRPLCNRFNTKTFWCPVMKSKHLKGRLGTRVRHIFGSMVRSFGDPRETRFWI